MGETDARRPPRVVVELGLLAALAFALAGAFALWRTHGSWVAWLAAELPVGAGALLVAAGRASGRPPDPPPLHRAPERRGP